MTKPKAKLVMSIKYYLAKDSRKQNTAHNKLIVFRVFYHGGHKRIELKTNIVDSIFLTSMPTNTGETEGLVASTDFITYCISRYPTGRIALDAQNHWVHDTAKSFNELTDRKIAIYCKNKFFYLKEKRYEYH